MEFYEEAGVCVILFNVFLDVVDCVCIKSLLVVKCGSVQGFLLGEKGVGGGIFEVLESPFDVLLFIDSNWS